MCAGKLICCDQRMTIEQPINRLRKPTRDGVLYHLTTWCVDVILCYLSPHLIPPPNSLLFLLRSLHSQYYYWQLSAVHGWLIIKARKHRQLSNLTFLLHYCSIRLPSKSCFLLPSLIVVAVCC
jgi:hypothetical protein